VYSNLFGTPVLDDTGDDGTEADSAGDLWGEPEADVPAVPPLPFTAYPPERAAYEAAFRAAYRYPDAMLLVMRGVRKGLRRGKEAAEAGGGE
jgi:hypothetical protein